MEPIRLIAMDMDGTLLGRIPKVIPPANVQALRRAQDAGVHLAIASGRLPDDAGFFALDAGLSMRIIALNGSAVLERPLGEICARHYIEPETALRILRLIESTGFTYSVFSDHDAIECHGEPGAELMLGTYLLRQGSRTKLSTLISDAMDRFDRVSKIVVMCHDDPSLLQPLRTQLEKEYPLVEISSSWINNIEINPIGINKGTALKELADSLNIPMSSVMAVGDNDNDVPMLRAAGYGVAMGNSTPAALKAAHWLTLPNHEDGVAAAIRALVLGENVSGVKPINS